ncbi:stromal interaction molecule 1 isoform X2 [Strongylocentrotus purpuratus]|uniref:SAM domain-containing protein n=1 Tax=Strongylocentrotus purpuratus TaxID=7668 RepID=A0A7M7NH37_STRPU|nr:stromal interaction molecule 1 isoform X2 [Strongylocentrotus purpuratus]
MASVSVNRKQRLSNRAYRDIYAIPVFIMFVWTTCVCLCVVGQFPVDSTRLTPASGTAKKGGGGTSAPLTDRSFEYPECSTKDVACIDDHREKDRLGKEGIMLLHRQMDDDHDGDVEPSESDEFLRDELKYEDDFERHSQLHRNDKEISAEELWKGWKYSEVYNWTVDKTVKWLEDSVDLPQYAERFQNNGIEGSALPRLAANSHQFMSTILGITDPLHRQKISVKAMDVVLFGPPKAMHNYLKDWLLVISLVVALGGCWFAFIQHRFSQSHVKQLLREMESLSSAEDSLKELQEKLNVAQEDHKSAVREKQSIEKQLTDEIETAKHEARRLERERIGDDTDGNSDLATQLSLAEEELVQVRSALDEAERRLSEEINWSAPMTLQQWLQLTYEIEYRYYVSKRVAAAKQLQVAKEECEKLRRKRASLIGSFRIAHGTSLDAVDQRIVSARTALHEVTAELKERTHRWNQIESVCQFAIMNNPGFQILMASMGGIPNGADLPGGQSPELDGPPQIPGSLSSAGSVIGSMAHVAENNPPMGLDEVEENMPPMPQQQPSYGAMKQALPMPRNTSQEFRRMAHQQRSGSQQSLGSMSGSQVIHRTHYQQPPQHQQAQIVQQQQQFGAGSSAASVAGSSSASGMGPSVNGNGSASGSNGSKYILGGDSSFERMSSHESSGSLPSNASFGSQHSSQQGATSSHSPSSSFPTSPSQGMVTSPHPITTTTTTSTNPNTIAASASKPLISSHHQPPPSLSHGMPPHRSNRSFSHPYRSSTHPLMLLQRKSFDSSYPLPSAPLSSANANQRVLHASRSDTTLSTLGSHQSLVAEAGAVDIKPASRVVNWKDITKKRREQLKKMGSLSSKDEDNVSSNEGDLAERSKKKSRLRLIRKGNKPDKVKTS